MSCCTFRLFLMQNYRMPSNHFIWNSINDFHDTFMMFFCSFWSLTGVVTEDCVESLKQWLVELFFNLFIVYWMF